MRVLRIQILLIYLKYIKIIQIYQIGFQVKTNIQKNSKTWKKERKVFFWTKGIKKWVNGNYYNNWCGKIFQI